MVGIEARGHKPLFYVQCWNHRTAPGGQKFIGFSFLDAIASQEMVLLHDMMRMDFFKGLSNSRKYSSPRILQE